MTDLTDAQIIRRLRSLEKGWPAGRGLYAMNGSLSLVATHADGDITPSDCIADFSGIVCDGGDW